MDRIGSTDQHVRIANEIAHLQERVEELERANTLLRRGVLKTDINDYDLAYYLMAEVDEMFPDLAVEITPSTEIIDRLIKESAEKQQLEARNKRLVEALEPFAKARNAPFFNIPMVIDGKGNKLSKADFRRAAELLAMIRREGEGE